MSLATIILAGAATIPAAACAWLAARAFEPALAPRAGVWLWRAARLSVAAPFAALIAVPAAGLLVRADGAQIAAGTAADRAPVAPPAFEPVIEFAAGLGQRLGHGVPDALLWSVAAIYAAGLVLFAVRAASRRRALARLIGSSRPAAGAIEATAMRWRAVLGLRPEHAPVRAVEAAISPFVAGLRPVVIVPAVLDAGPAAEAAIAHELTHVKRGDERDRLIGEGLAALFWFNPFVRCVERRLAGARELACDADVLDRADPALKRSYARAVAELAPMNACATGFLTELADLRRRRVAAALSHDAGARAGRAGAAIAGALVLAAALPAAGLAAMLAERAQDAAADPRQLNAALGETILEVQALVDAGDFEGALQVLDAASPATPYERSVIERQRGAALFQLDRHADAIAAFEAAVETGALSRDETMSMLTNIVQLYAVTEQFEVAADLIGRIEGLSDGPVPARLKRLFAQIFIQAGDAARALPYAEAYVAETSDPSVSDLTMLRFVYLETGREAEADAVSERIAALGEN